MGLSAAACSGSDASDAPPAAGLHAAAHDLELLPAPTGAIGVTDLNGDPAYAWPPASESDRRTTSGGGDALAAIGEHGHLGSLTDPSIDDVWLKWRARPSLDGATAVLTLRDSVARTLHETPIAWVPLPDAIRADELVLAGASELNAVSYDGELVALTNFAEPQRRGEIAGAKASTTLRIADRHGIRFEAELDGNFVAEAFGRAAGRNGLPAQVFLLEHVPADAPRFYRVRVLSTESGEISLPLNLRDKSQLVDERMSGLSRSQVVADDHGLLFTLYRGTLDGTPDGEPYAFVHTLDLANGVWCLFVDPALELDKLPGSIAAGGDRLFVASANGKIGSIPIPAITDVGRSPEMDWVTDGGAAGTQPPVLLADAEGVWIGPHDGSEQLLRLNNDGDRQDVGELPGAYPTALAFDGSGRLIAAGDGWSTFGEFSLPDWFGAPAAVFPG